jgi:hypothetical protein
MCVTSKSAPILKEIGVDLSTKNFLVFGTDVQNQPRFSIVIITKNRIQINSQPEMPVVKDPATELRTKLRTKLRSFMQLSINAS